MNAGVGWKIRNDEKTNGIGDAVPGSRAGKRAVANHGARAGLSNYQPASQWPEGAAVSSGSRCWAADVANSGSAPRVTNRSGKSMTHPTSRSTRLARMRRWALAGELFVGLTTRIRMQ